MITKEYLGKMMRYDPETGDFIRTRNINKYHIGDIIGTVGSDGYLCTSIDGKSYKLHRIAFVLMTGSWPPEQVDHINSIRLDNRWTNLRTANWAENSRNSPKQKNNTSGWKNIRKRRSGNWEVRVGYNRRHVHLGTYDCPAAAAFAAMVEKDKLHGEFARAD